MSNRSPISQTMLQRNQTNNTSRTRRARRTSTINARNARESRVHRKELWFETTTQGTGSYTFNADHFPEWFGNYSRLYETYRMHNIRIHWTSGYSKFAGGYVYVSYNTNPAQSGETFTLQSIFAQQNAGRSQISANGQFLIPRSAYSQQPNRRQCSGPDSYLFDLRYYISANAFNNQPIPGSITFWIEYDCTFYTPQSSTTSGPTKTMFAYNSTDGIIADTSDSLEDAGNGFEITGSFNYSKNSPKSVNGYNSVESYTFSNGSTVTSTYVTSGGSTTEQITITGDPVTVYLNYSLTPTTISGTISNKHISEIFSTQPITKFTTQTKQYDGIVLV